MRVLALGHEPLQLDLVLILAPVLVVNEQSLARSVAQNGDRRCERHDTRRRHLAPEQGVDQRALAALELTEHDKVETRLPHPLGALTQMPRDRRTERLARQLHELVDRVDRARLRGGGEVAVH